MDIASNQPRAALLVVKLVHTIVWAFFAGCIFAIPFFAWRQRFGTVLFLAAVVLVEIAILALNGLRCPLTGVASRFTQDRQDNFDIYLPLWIARHNKTIFGWLFGAGLLFSLARWSHWL